MIHGNPCVSTSLKQLTNQWFPEWPWGFWNHTWPGLKMWFECNIPKCVPPQKKKHEKISVFSWVPSPSVVNLSHTWSRKPGLWSYGTWRKDKSSGFGWGRTAKGSKSIAVRKLHLIYVESFFRGIVCGSLVFFPLNLSPGTLQKWNKPEAHMKIRLPCFLELHKTFASWICSFTQVWSVHLSGFLWVEFSFWNHVVCWHNVHGCWQHAMSIVKIVTRVGNITSSVVVGNTCSQQHLHFWVRYVKQEKPTNPNADHVM